MIRIYIDTNDMDRTGWCNLLLFEGRSLDEVASALSLSEGMPVVLFYQDPAEEFEFDGTVHFRDGHWVAKADLDSYRLISVTPLEDLRKQSWFKE